MTTRERLSASVDSDLLEAGRLAVAEGRAPNLSAWVNDALQLKLLLDQRLQALDEFFTEYEREHGEITEEEMERAYREAKSRAIVVRGRRKSTQERSRSSSKGAA